MMILAVPLYLLYELGLFMLRMLPADRVARGVFVKPEPATAGDA
jgi:Sec-independent protein secretion pathway component TatC